MTDIKVVQVWNNEELLRESCDTLGGLRTKSLHTCEMIIWRRLNIQILILLDALTLESRRQDMSLFS